mmetsp:Transcript_13843/g.39781  ORF Transcript_13843/g.39781 Transcript_13843/m.39781 type:complete len:337 (+) Transcript_13843:72-1082(+)
MDASEGRADAADSARDSRECRICHAGAEDGPLSQPCGCRGSASWVHRACLERWRRSSTRRDAAYRCGTCKVEFRDELSLELLRARLDAQRERGSAGALHSMSRLAVELQAQGRLAEAEPLLREALEVCRATRGASHSDTLLSTTRLAALLQDRGELAQAEPLCREALEASRAALGTRHATYLVAMNDLASLLHDRGKLSQAHARTLARSLALWRAFAHRHPPLDPRLSRSTASASRPGGGSSARAIRTRSSASPTSARCCARSAGWRRRRRCRRRRCSWRARRSAGATPTPSPTCPIWGCCGWRRGGSERRRACAVRRRRRAARRRGCSIRRRPRL